MKKTNIIKSNRDFTNIIKKRNGVSNKYFILNIEDNNLNKAMFGITFIKNIGNAVTRNKLKRRVKSIIDNNENIYQNNCLLMLMLTLNVMDESLNINRSVTFIFLFFLTFLG